MSHAYNIRPLPTASTPPRRRRAAKAGLFLVIIICSIAIYVSYALLRPLGQPKTTLLPPVVSGEVGVNVPWPSAGQAAYGADGFGVLASHGEQKPVPTASIAKAITALAILDKKPLTAGQPGPLLTVTPEFAALYGEYVAKDGSAVPVYIGQQITQYQAMQAMMLPSANNIADMAAIWAFGSLEAYRTYASGMVKRLGMNQTTIGTDASGYSPTTISTASDLIQLGDAVLDNPVLSDIVSQPQAILPEYGTISNVNSLLGTAGIRGIKTGNTDEAGGCFLGAADTVINGKKVTVITAILGSPSRSQALRETVPMAQSAVSLFRTAHIVDNGDTVGRISTEWGASTDIIANQQISVLAWNGHGLAPEIRSTSLANTAPAKTPAGDLSLTYGKTTYSAKLETKTALQPPSATWRLTHPM